MADEKKDSSDTTQWEPRIVAFLCNWCSYAGADLAGMSRFAYPAAIKIIRLPCSGRVDPMFVLKSFERGADMVLVSGCHPGDCHYASGNYHARRKLLVFRELMTFLGIDPQRFKFSWVSAAQGAKWSSLVDEITAEARALGPFKAFAEILKEQPGLSGDAVQVPGASRTPERSILSEGKDASRTPVRRPPITSTTESLRQAASRVLSEGQAQVVIGYSRPNGAAFASPAFVRNAEDTDRLVFDNQCFANLAVYLPRDEVRQMGKAAVVLKGCDLRAVNVLLRENVIERDNVVLIGVRCDGMGEPVLHKCSICELRDPDQCDVVVGEPVQQPEAGDQQKYPDADVVDAMSIEQRWEFWQDKLAKCIRCYACRQVCPLCYCKRCIVEKSMPHWVETSAHRRGNLAWSVARALHLTGRCVGCGECERVCPMDIPLGAINQKMAKIVAEWFDFHSGLSPDEKAPFTTFSLDDSDEGIL